MKVPLLKLISTFVVFALFFSCSNDSPNDPPPPDPIACEGQISLSITDLSGTSASISWTTSGEYASYEVEYGAKDFDQGQGTITTYNNINAELIDLEVNTEYDVYIRGRCGTDSSNWFGPISFATLCDAGAFVGDVLLTTQAEVDAFTIQCYTSIEGNLTLMSDFNASEGITDLSGFSGLTEVLGELLIKENGLLLSLDGLEGIRKVISLKLDSNSNLQSISGLRNLEEFVELPNEDFNARTLSISYTGLTSLVGLEKITSLQNLLIVGTSVTSLDGLDNLESVSRILTLSYNPSLESLNSLQSLVAVGEFLTIFYNSSLTSLNGLDNLESVGVAITLQFNDALNSIQGLSGLNSVERILLEENPLLSSLAGINYTSIEFSLQLVNNDGLQDFNGLQFDATTSAFLEVKDCDGITSMSGLEGLTDTFGLQFSENQNLLSLDGLENITICRNQIYIQDNPILTDFCALSALIQNGGLQGVWLTEFNDYNPDLSQMQAGQCVP
jgi:hypothetical protein